jgi:hypothetical protein
MNWFKIFTLIATVITFLAFLYQTYLLLKLKVFMKVFGLLCSGLR